jgi:hypothetical protein
MSWRLTATPVYGWLKEARIDQGVVPCSYGERQLLPVWPSGCAERALPYLGRERIGD